MAYQEFPIRFGGGVNNKDADFDIQDIQASSCSNIIFDEKESIKTRLGYAIYGDDGGSNSISGLFRYYYNNGAGTITYNIFRTVNTDFYLNVAGTFTAQGRALTANTPGMWVEAENEGYWFNGTDAVQNLANTTWSSLASGTPMSGANNIGRYAVYKGGMLFVAGTNANPNTVYVSGDANDSLNTPETFTGGWAYIVGKNKKGKITGLIELGNYVVVFQEYGITMLDGSTGSTQTQIEIPGNVGSCSQRSIMVFNDGRSVLFQAMDGHVYSFDSVNVVKQSETIQTTIESVNTAQLHKSNAEIFDYRGRKYILNYCSGSSTTPNATIVLDLERTSIGSTDPNKKVWLPWSGIRSVQMLRYSSNGTKESLYFAEATADTKTYTMFSGTNDNGVAITSTYETKNFSLGKQDVDKKFKYLYINAKATGSWNLNIKYSIDGGAFASTTPGVIDLTPTGAVMPFTLPSTMSEGFLASNNTVAIPATARFIKIQFSISTIDNFFHIYSATLLAKLGKLRRRIS